MPDRPDLDTLASGQDLAQHYYLLSELKGFCRAHGLPTGGGKQAIAARIAHYIDTGEILPAPAPRRSAAVPIQAITPDTPIEPDIVCSQTHRAFFKDQIGKSFTFNTAFQQWLKAHPGTPYRDAVTAYHTLREAAKALPTQISSQFEYNTYIRDFYAANPGRPLTDAIACWRYRKAQPAPHRYHPDDLSGAGLE